MVFLMVADLLYLHYDVGIPASLSSLYGNIHAFRFK